MNEAQKTLDKINDCFPSARSSQLDRDLLLKNIQIFYEQVMAIPPESKLSDEKEDVKKKEIEPVAMPKEKREQKETIKPANPKNTGEEVQEKKPKKNKLFDFLHKETNTTNPPASQTDDEDRPRPTSSNISFELPQVPEKEPKTPAEGIEENDPKENAPRPVDIPVSSNEGKKHVPDYTEIFNFNKDNQKASTKDIRKNIGINDKYLFINELFNSEKEDYEQALDKINNMPTPQKAVEWVKTELAQPRQWHNEDDTVQSFYGLLDRHFNTK